MLLGEAPTEGMAFPQVLAVFQGISLFAPIEFRYEETNALQAGREGPT